MTMYPRQSRISASRWRRTAAALAASLLLLAACDDGGDEGGEEAGGDDEACSNGPGYHGASVILTTITPDPGAIPLGEPLECSLGGMTAGLPEIGYATTWAVYGDGLKPPWSFGLTIFRDDITTGPKLIQQSNTNKVGEVTMLLGVAGADGMIVGHVPVEPNPGSLSVTRHDGEPGGLIEGEFADVVFTDLLEPPGTYAISGSFSLTIPTPSGG